MASMKRLLLAAAVLFATSAVPQTPPQLRVRFARVDASSTSGSVTGSSATPGRRQAGQEPQPHHQDPRRMRDPRGVHRRVPARSSMAAASRRTTARRKRGSRRGWTTPRRYLEFDGGLVDGNYDVLARCAAGGHARLKPAHGLPRREGRQPHVVVADARTTVGRPGSRSGTSSTGDSNDWAPV